MDEMMDTQQPEQADQNIVKAAIGDEEIRKAAETLREYRNGREPLKTKIITNEKWWRLQQDEFKRNKSVKLPDSAWMFSCIVSKLADMMDNYPEPATLPTEPSDKDIAQTMTSVLPVVLEQNNYEQTYKRACLYLIKHGINAQKVYWDKYKKNRLGDIGIKKVDVLDLIWEPGIMELQDSMNVFHPHLEDKETLDRKHPQFAGNWGNADGTETKYVYDDKVNISGKAEVVDWWYMRHIESMMEYEGEQVDMGNEVVHLCQFCNGHLLFASENMEAYKEKGYYWHGRYPFEVEELFPSEAGLGCGLGYIDICKNPQLYTDKLDDAILKSAIISATKRYFSKGQGVKEEDYADLSKDIIPYEGSGNPTDSIMAIETPAPNPNIEGLKQNKIGEMKETSQNNDFTQGTAGKGVTAASAIAALQEAGSKGSRLVNKGTHFTFRQVCYMCIDLMGQFYTEDRYFRITGPDGGMQHIQFNGLGLRASEQGDGMVHKPILDIKVKAQRSSPFSTLAQNELAKELYGLRFFDPTNADQAIACLEIMNFEGKDIVLQRISRNSQIPKLLQLAVAMAAEADRLSGQQLYLPQVIQVAQMMGQQLTLPQPATPPGAQQGISAPGLLEKAHAASAQNATPR